MPRMISKFLERRKEWILSSPDWHANRNKYYPYPGGLHKRSYVRGDMRCTNCYKWLNPEIPEEAAQIRLAKNGRRMHLDCPVNSSTTPTLCAHSRNTCTGRRMRLNLIARY